MDKRQARLRRARRSRAKIQELNVHRLCIYRTPRHIYAQIIAPNGGHVVVSASTVEKTFHEKQNHSGNVTAATFIGQVIAERARAAGVERVAFDRSGFKYHGRVKALADSAREHGLQF
ncbi:50S ribosomal protein L18 [Rhodoferax sp. 4810]|uniref:Large ribosomal subunit protein uL18 n=1 Tax=Thiospirillum jenense TaxID=1653858 RepID=A0A839HCG4_9GAMM|nr:50S ribosomal protein L18 [Thiospirillum jenense]MBB1073010.1 50S ribosomal protein L18 [Rhodoferax jenense]MBB1124958.1 50S ribosomal protein L18 [Thiospirillum jenense]